MYIPVVMNVVIIILLLCSKKVAAVVAGATRLNGHEIATINCPKYNVAKLLEDPGSTQVLCNISYQVNLKIYICKESKKKNEF